MGGKLRESHLKSEGKAHSSSNSYFAKNFQNPLSWSVMSLLKQGKMNVMVDAFSMRHALIAMLEKDMLGLDCIKELHEKTLI
ncbi:hypothetical protein CR513_10964, partial [Mucuna pruriens]